MPAQPGKAAGPRIPPQLKKIHAGIATVAAVGSVVSGLAGFYQVYNVLRNRAQAPVTAVASITGAESAADTKQADAKGKDGDADVQARAVQRDADRAAVERLIVDRRLGVVPADASRTPEQKQRDQDEATNAADRAQLRLLLQRRDGATGDEANRLELEIRMLVRRQVEQLARRNQQSKTAAE